MRVRNGFIGSGFGEPGAHPHQEFPGISSLPWGLKSGRKKTKTLCSSRCAILSISQSTFFNCSLLYSVTWGHFRVIVPLMFKC